MKILGFSVVVFPEGKSYSAWCPELDVASQGESLENAILNLKEAVELHLECLNAKELNEIRKRQGTKLVTTIEVPVPS